MPALCYAASRPECFHLFSAFSIKVDTELAVPVDVAPRAEATAYENDLHDRISNGTPYPPDLCNLKEYGKRLVEIILSFCFR